MPLHNDLKSCLHILHIYEETNVNSRGELELHMAWSLEWDMRREPSQKCHTSHQLSCQSLGRVRQYQIDRLDVGKRTIYSARPRKRIIYPTTLSKKNDIPGTHTQNQARRVSYLSVTKYSEQAWPKVVESFVFATAQNVCPNIGRHHRWRCSKTTKNTALFWPDFACKDGQFSVTVLLP